LNYPDNVRNCIITSPHFISNIVFISNMNLPEGEWKIAFADKFDLGDISVFGDELIVSRFTQMIEAGQVVVGAS